MPSGVYPRKKTEHKAKEKAKAYTYTKRHPRSYTWKPPEERLPKQFQERELPELPFDPKPSKLVNGGFSVPMAETHVSTCEITYTPHDFRFGRYKTEKGLERVVMEIRIEARTPLPYNVIDMSMEESKEIIDALIKARSKRKYRRKHERKTA